MKSDEVMENDLKDNEKHGQNVNDDNSVSVFANELTVSYSYKYLCRNKSRIFYRCQISDLIR